MSPIRTLAPVALLLFGFGAAAQDSPPAAPTAATAVPACTLGNTEYPPGTMFTAPNSCDRSGYCSIRICWQHAWFTRTLGCNQRAQSCPPDAPR